jgi:hypothetical protein
MRSSSLSGVDLDLKSVEIYAFNAASIEIDSELLFERVARIDCQLVDWQTHWAIHSCQTTRDTVCNNEELQKWATRAFI